MKNNTVRFLAILICVFTAFQSNAFAQQQITFEQQYEDSLYGRYRANLDRDRLDRMVDTNLNNLARLAQNRDSAYVGNSTFANRPEKTSELKTLLKISSGEVSAYDNFLNLPNTGAVKLLPLNDCSAAAEKEVCFKQNLNLMAFANSYSFRENDYKFSSQADLIVVKDFFATSQNANQSLFVNLGDVALENLTLNSDGMNYLVNFVPERKAEKVNKQYEEIEKGVKVGDFKYVKSLPIVENTTYALRSVAYKGSEISPGEIADVIIAFRVISLDDNGAATIIWKELSRKDGVKLKR